MEPDPGTAFEQLRDYVAKYDPIALLSQLTFTFLFVPATEFYGENSDCVKWQRRIEFLAGLLLTKPFPNGTQEIIDGPVIEEVEHLLDRYFDSLGLHVADTFEPTSDIDADALIASATIYSLFVRWVAYPHHLVVFAIGLYT